MLTVDFSNLISQLFSLKGLSAKIIIAVISSLFLVLIAKKFFQIIQQCSYQNADYKRWLSRKGNVYVTRISLLFMLSFLAYILFVTCLEFLSSEWVIYIGFIFYILFIAIYLVGDKRHKDRCKLVYTKRIKRLHFTYFILSLILSFAILVITEGIMIAFNAGTFILSLRYSLIVLTPVFTALIAGLSNSINAPIERLFSKKYILSAKEKLDSNNNLIKIAITGSYGKTTLKNILQTLLSVKYKVYATPKSFNTPLGVSKAVNDELDSSYDIFIAEMGARHKGDIKQLCDIVKPKFGVITGITTQHLDTFKNLEEIIATKSELIDAVSDSVFLSSDNENTIKLKDKYQNKQFITAGLDKTATITAQDVELKSDGLSFVLNLDGEKVNVSTRLLGVHNVSNICLAVAVAKKLGLTAQEIAQGIMNIKQVNHRLELVPNDKDITILDDSYNCNIEGYKCAVQTALSLSENLIVVTPGLVEMGKLEKQENINFGKYLASRAKKVVLVGSYGAYNIREGLLEENFPFDSIIMAKTLDDAKSKLAGIIIPKCVVLFENDIPDRFL